MDSGGINKVLGELQATAQAAAGKPAAAVEQTLHNQVGKIKIKLMKLLKL